MNRFLFRSMKYFSHINVGQYSWVITTASIVALILYQRGKSGRDDRSDDEDDDNNSEQILDEAKNGTASITTNQRGGEGSKKKGTTRSSSIDEDQEKVKRANNNSSSSHSQQQQRSTINITSGSGVSKREQFINGLKKLGGQDKPRGSSGTRNGQGRKGVSQIDEKQSQSDVENTGSRTSRSLAFANSLRKSRKFITDVDEPTQLQRRNQILKVAYDQPAGDTIFFQVLASLAENDDDYE